jgi:hypothetical protein
MSMSENSVNWELLNPGYAPSTKRESTPMVPRPGELRRKRIGLFWNTKPNGDVFLSQIGAALRERFYDAELVEWLPGKMVSNVGAAPEMLAEVAKRCDLVIGAVGD